MGAFSIWHWLVVLAVVLLLFGEFLWQDSLTHLLRWKCKGFVLERSSARKQRTFHCFEERFQSCRVLISEHLDHFTLANLSGMCQCHANMATRPRLARHSPARSRHGPTQSGMVQRGAAWPGK